jgi:hypothetical protein
MPEFHVGERDHGISVRQHWDARLGYLWGSRLKINSSNNDISLRLQQKGPVFAVEYHWGKRQSALTKP